MSLESGNIGCKVILVFRKPRTFHNQRSLTYVQLEQVYHTSKLCRASIGERLKLRTCDPNSSCLFAVIIYRSRVMRRVGRVSLMPMTLNRMFACHRPLILTLLSTAGIYGFLTLCQSSCSLSVFNYFSKS